MLPSERNAALVGRSDRLLWYAMHFGNTPESLRDVPVPCQRFTRKFTERGESSASGEAARAVAMPLWTRDCRQGWERRVGQPWPLPRWGL